MMRKSMYMGSLPVAGSDGLATYGGGDSPGPGGPHVVIASHERMKPLFPA